jgi:hypothetical protein
MFEHRELLESFFPRPPSPTFPTLPETLADLPPFFEAAAPAGDDPAASRHAFDAPLPV